MGLLDTNTIEINNNNVAWPEEYNRCDIGKVSLGVEEDSKITFHVFAFLDLCQVCRVFQP